MRGGGGGEGVELPEETPRGATRQSVNWQHKTQYRERECMIHIARSYNLKNITKAILLSRLPMCVFALINIDTKTSEF